MIKLIWVLMVSSLSVNAPHGFPDRTLPVPQGSRYPTAVWIEGQPNVFFTRKACEQARVVREGVRAATKNWVYNVGYYCVQAAMALPVPDPKPSDEDPGELGRPECGTTVTIGDPRC